jgi:hypothetical protein
LGIKVQDVVSETGLALAELTHVEVDDLGSTNLATAREGNGAAFNGEIPDHGFDLVNDQRYNFRACECIHMAGAKICKEDEAPILRYLFHRRIVGRPRVR